LALYAVVLTAFGSPVRAKLPPMLFRRPALS